MMHDKTLQKWMAKKEHCTEKLKADKKNEVHSSEAEL